MKLGIFGGTFDPVHRGHIAVAKAAVDEFGLDEVLLIPAGSPPHKHAPVGAPYEHRYRMVELASSGEARLRPSRLEAPTADRDRHYSIETIERLRNELEPEQQLFFIIGADAFAEITLWRRWREVIRLVEFIVVSRPGIEVSESDVPAEARTHWLRSVQVPISSTEIRELLRNGRPAEQWLPPAVAQYIQEHGLYGCRAPGKTSSSGRVARG